MSHLSIKLLGALDVRIEDESVVDELSADKVRALLAYLAVEGDQVHRRERLAGLLWPDDPEANARRNLRTTLYRLRSAIGDHDATPPFLLITRDTLQRNPEADIEVDVRAFQRLVAAANTHTHDNLDHCPPCLERLEKAAALYQGDLLPDFSLDSDLFESWLVSQREELHVQALAALEILADFHLDHEAYDAALAYARQQISLEPWLEGAHRQAMRALALSGQRAAAVSQYEICRQILDEELGIEPEPATVVLYEQVRAGALTPRLDRAPDAHPMTGTVRAAANDFSVVLPEPAPVMPSRSEPRVPSQAEILGWGDLLPQGERRITSFVLAEVSGAEVADRDIEVWAAWSHAVLERLRAAVARFDGTVVQTREAGLVAAFGAEVAHEDDAERAVLAAMAMMAATEISPELEEAARIDVALRVGVTTGEAIILLQDTGGVTVHAAVLTQAQAVQAQVPPGTLWVGDATYRRVEMAFEWTWLGEVRVPGAAPVRAYRPTAVVETGAEHDVGGLRAPLVGRAVELQTVIDAVARVKAGIGGVVSVVGEAGIGKSRLVAEAKRHNQTAPAMTADAPPEIRWVEGRWLSYTEGVAYHGWRELLRNLLALPDACTQESCVALEEQLLALCPDRAAEIYPYLARLLALPVDAATAAQLDSLVAAGLLQGAIFRAVADLLICAANQTPLVIVLEDLHWADEVSLLLLAYALELTDQGPLLIVTLMRPERSRGCWRVRETMIRDYGHRHTDVQLAPLSAEESTLLVRRLMAAARGEDLLDEGWVHQVQERAEGNPFFTAEIVRSLLNQDAVAGILPMTVQEVLMARIGRLSVAARQVLQVAAVIGRLFHYRLLAEIVAGPQGGKGQSASDRRTLDAALLHLMRAQLIRERVWGLGEAPDAGLERGPQRGPERAYIFEHQLTLEAAYESLLHRKRRVLHRRVAEAMERLYPEHVAVQLGVLAHHWEQAGDGKRAIDYLHRAGDQAAAQYANGEALSFYSRALALVPEDDNEMRYTLLMAREQISRIRGDREAQHRDLESLEAMVSDGHDPYRQAEVALRRSHLAADTYHMAVAQTAAEQAIRLAHRIGDVRLEVLGYLRLAEAKTESSAGSPYAWEDLKKALALSRSAGLRRLEAEIMSQLGAGMSGNQHPEGRALVRRALAYYREVGDRPNEGWALSALANTYGSFGEYEQAREAGLQSLAVFREVGVRVGEGYRHYASGYTAMCLGLFGEALAHLKAARALCRDVGSSIFESRSLVCMGVAFDFLGAYEQAWSSFEAALSFSVERAGFVTWVWGLVQTALLWFHRDDMAQARVYARRAIDFMDSLGDAAAQGWLPYDHALAHLVMGHAFLQLDQGEAAITHYRQGLAVPLKAGPPGTPFELRAGLARAYLSQGDVDIALDHVKQILDFLEHGHLHGTMEPLRIYLTCYHVLARASDPRASRVLDDAHTLLQDRAAKIDDEALRHSYLENVAVNREIAEL